MGRSAWPQADETPDSRAAVLVPGGGQYTGGQGSTAGPRTAEFSIGAAQAVDISQGSRQAEGPSSA